MGGWVFFFFQAEDGIRDRLVTGVQTCALPILGGDPKVTMLYEHKQAELISKRIKVLQSRRKLATGYRMVDVLGYLVQAQKLLSNAIPPTD